MRIVKNFGSRIDRTDRELRPAAYLQKVPYVVALGPLGNPALELCSFGDTELIVVVIDFERIVAHRRAELLPQLFRRTCKDDPQAVLGWKQAVR